MGESQSHTARLVAMLKAVAVHEPVGGTTTSLARAAGLPRPTAHRVLTALAEHGLIDRAASGRWFLGPETYLLGLTSASRYDPSSIARPVVKRLAEVTEESAFYSMRRGGETVCLVREDGSFPLRSHVLHEGIRFPLGVASAGLVILSFLPDEEVDRFLQQHNLVHDFGLPHEAEEIRKRIRSTRDLGFALNPGLIVPGSWGMAAAVFAEDGSPIGALSITGIEQRFSSDRQKTLGRLLRRAAHDLTKHLSARFDEILS